MKVAIDFREGARQQRAGKGEYVFELTRHLLDALPGDVQVILLLESGQSSPFPAHRCTVKTFPRRLGLWHWTVACWLTIFRPVDAYWASSSVIVPALAFRVRMITTIFDFSAWRFPSKHHRLATLLERSFAGLAYRRSSHLLAISEFTKQEAVRWIDLNPDRITVTPLAIDHSIFLPRHLSLSVTTTLRTKYHLPERFILYLGTLEPRKNLLRLIAAFSQTKASISPTKLVLAGSPGWFSEKIIAAAKRDPDIVLPGYISAADRPLLYNLASVFAFPSLYEGFGMPPLEAMASGVPVIVSTTASLPEVVGEAALMVDPKDTPALAAALHQLCRSEAEQGRLRQAGLSRAHQFTWGRTALLTSQIIIQYGKSR